MCSRPCEAQLGDVDVIVGQHVDGAAVARHPLCRRCALHGWTLGRLCEREREHIRIQGWSVPVCRW